MSHSDILNLVEEDLRNRDGSWTRARSTLNRLLHPDITITDPPQDATVEWDVPVPMRDGIRLRVNVFRPDDGEPHPVLLCAHPYGKDDMPLHHKTRHGYRPTLQYHLMRSAPLTHSAWTTWEGPDPAHWVERGYVVVNADLRGWGTSEGEPEVLSEQEGLDIYDLIEWAAQQPWSTGRVGMSGVSYLAVSQWIGAATRPPHLAAICPWEAFTDFYRDFARPGGILETGFLTVWGTAMKRRSHGTVDLSGEAHDRPLFDGWYASRNRGIEAIEVPALVCGSFSDHNLHTRGSFEGFRRIDSPRSGSTPTAGPSERPTTRRKGWTRKPGSSTTSSRVRTLASPSSRRSAWRSERTAPRSPRCAMSPAGPLRRPSGGPCAVVGANGGRPAPWRRLGPVCRAYRTTRRSRCPVGEAGPASPTGSPATPTSSGRCC